MMMEGADSEAEFLLAAEERLMGMIGASCVEEGPAAEAGVEFPGLTPRQRFLLHQLCEAHGCGSRSEGCGADRTLLVTAPRVRGAPPVARLGGVAEARNWLRAYPGGGGAGIGSRGEVGGGRGARYVPPRLRAPAAAARMSAPATPAVPPEAGDGASAAPRGRARPVGVYAPPGAARAAASAGARAPPTPPPPRGPAVAEEDAAARAAALDPAAADARWGNDMYLREEGAARGRRGGSGRAGWRDGGAERGERGDGRGERAGWRDGDAERGERGDGRGECAEWREGDPAPEPRAVAAETPRAAAALSAAAGSSERAGARPSRQSGQAAASGELPAAPDASVPAAATGSPVLPWRPRRELRGDEAAEYSGAGSGGPSRRELRGDEVAEYSGAGSGGPSRRAARGDEVADDSGAGSGGPSRHTACAA